jgi:endonuclease/exonuclease/phosphatase (EEP) superfamily protein YafD
MAGIGAALSLAGRACPQLDLYAHFAPLYVAAALVAVILAGRAWRIRLGAGLALAAAMALIVPEYLRDAGPTAPADAPGQIRVIQFNAEHRNNEVQRVARWLLAQDADIITVTEARHDLRDILKREGWRTAGGHGYLIIFVREGFTQMDRPHLSDHAKLTYVNATYATASGPMEAVTVHMRWPNDPGIRARLRELESITARLPRERMVLTGDFNTTPWSAQMGRLDEGLGLSRRDRGVATWPAKVMGHRWPLPFLPIDHVYAGPGWATVRVERGPWLGSDHYPLIVTLAPARP